MTDLAPPAQDTPRVVDPLADAIPGRLHEHERQLLISSRAYTAAFFALGGIVFALASQRPELLLFSAPLLLALGLAAVAPPWMPCRWTSLRRPRVRSRVTRRRSCCVCGPVLPPSWWMSRSSSPTTSRPWSLAEPSSPLNSGLDHLVTIPVKLVDFGVGTPESLHLTTHGPFGFFLQRQSFTVELPVRVLLSAERTRTLLSPRRYRNSAGSHLSAQRGEGCEIADLRPYQQGDRLKNINRRVSQRRGELWVTERHPDRSSDLILMFDNANWIGKEDEETVRQAIRAVIGLSQQHLRSHDRVGVLQFGSKVRWVAPRLGRFQSQKIVDSLLELRASLRVPSADDASSTASTLPPNAVMVAFTPLTSRTVRQSLIRYRRHGLTVTVVELQPPSLWRVPEDPDERNAFRLFRLNHELVRDELRDMGVQVVPWTPDVPLEELVRQVDLITRSKRGGGLR